MPRNSLNFPTPKKSDNDRENDEDLNIIRVGRQFQAEIPAFLGSSDESEESHQDSYKDSLNICVWEPSSVYSADIVEAYVKEAVEHGFTVEQALGILLFNKYDVAQSKADLAEYAPNEDPIDAWDEDDRVLFEIAYRLNSKSFAKIRESLPNKKISELVHYYYTWKKNKTRRHDFPNLLQSWKTGNGAKNRPCRPYDSVLGAYSEGNSSISYTELKLPDDVEVFMDGEHVSVELQEEIKAFDRECLEVKHRIQHSKQLIGQTKKTLPKIDGQTIDEVHIRDMKHLAQLEEEAARDEFVDAEVYMFCLALKDYGADFEKIALILRAKTPAVLSRYYEQNKAKYRLEKYVKEFEKKKNVHYC